MVCYGCMYVYIRGVIPRKYELYVVRNYIEVIFAAKYK